MLLERSRVVVMKTPATALATTTAAMKNISCDVAVAGIRTLSYV
jgi:hypothetical protein